MLFRMMGPPEEAEEKKAAGPAFLASHVDANKGARISMKEVLQWHVVEMFVGTGAKRRQILDDNRGEARTGTLTALLGPSGAGKTSLLECISLRCRDFKGSVLVDGASPQDFFATSALVYQKELLFPFMTAREHLLFHATARMSAYADREAIEQRISQVVFETNLGTCLDTVIGGIDPLFMAKGLSGGERKRLGLASELLRCPAIVFLDEPTSGLDSVMAETVVSTLAQLASTGRIVVASLHCPSSDVMAHISHLMLLTYDGRVAYHGPRTEAVGHFVSAGYPYPSDYNPADYMLLIASRSQYKPAQVEKDRVDAVVKSFAASPLNTADALPTIDVRQISSNVLPTQSSSWTLFKLNVNRAILYQRREKWVIIAAGMVSVIIGLLFGVLFWKQASSSWRNLLGLNYSVTVSTLIFASTAMVLEVPLGQAILHREFISGVNSPGPFLSAFFLSGWPYYAAPIFEATVIYWMTGMRPNVSDFFSYCLILVLTSLASLTLGVFVGSVSQHVVLCLIILPAFEVPMIMFSGLLYERSSVPAWLAWIEKVSIVNHGFAALSIKTADFLGPTYGPALLHFLEIDSNNLPFHLYMLVVLNVMFIVGAYIIIKIRFQAAGTKAAVI